MWWGASAGQLMLMGADGKLGFSCLFWWCFFFSNAVCFENAENLARASSVSGGAVPNGVP